jgi:hypothetical protein
VYGIPPSSPLLQSGPLLTVTLETLLRYLSWIPIGYVLETSVIEILVLKFFPFALFQNIALQVRAVAYLLLLNIS